MSFYKREEESVKEVWPKEKFSKLPADYSAKHPFLIFISPLDEIFIYHPIHAKGFAARSLSCRTLPALLELKPNRASRACRGVTVFIYYSINSVTP